MLKESDMVNQSTFFKYDDNCWYDSEFEYQLKFIGSRGGLCILYSYSEVDGESEEIKRVKDLSHLQELYEILTNKIFV